MKRISVLQRLARLRLLLIYCSLQYSFCRHLRTYPRVQQFGMFPWAHRSINSTKFPITYPAASTTKIGVTVTMLTSIVDSCSSGSFKRANCCWILSWIPLSRICANLWRNLYWIKRLIHFYVTSEEIKVVICLSYINLNSIYCLTSS